MESVVGLAAVPGFRSVAVGDPATFFRGAEKGGAQQKWRRGWISAKPGMMSAPPCSESSTCNDRPQQNSPSYRFWEKPGI